MGPTGLLPRSQYFTRDHEGALQGEDQLDNREPDGRMASDELSQRDECLREAVHNLEPDSLLEEMKAVVPGGSCVLMHCAQHTLPLHFFCASRSLFGSLTTFLCCALDDIFHRATRRIPDDEAVPWRASKPTRSPPAFNAGFDHSVFAQC